LVIVIEATGTLPVLRAQNPAPYFDTSWWACGALRTSFQSSAGRTGVPASSMLTKPCCWPATPMAAQRSRAPSDAVSRAATHAAGSISVPSG
jgi:hypothetical protein